MKRAFIVVVMIATFAIAAFANGNAEKLTTLEGTVVVVPGENGGVQTMLRTASGKQVVIDMPAQELLRLRLEENSRVRVSGVFVGDPSGLQVQARILARVVTANGKDIPVEKPVGVTEQDRDRIRAYEEEQLKLQTRLQTQDQTQSQDQTQDRTQAQDGSGTGTSTGRK